MFLLLNTPLKAAGERIGHVTIQNGTHVSNDLIASVLTIKEGDTFNEDKLNTSLVFLKKWGRFKQVTHQLRRHGGRVDIEISLKEVPIIVKIDIRGHYPFMKRRVKAPITIRVGDPYDPVSVAEQSGRIEHFFEGEGYLGTHVTVEQHFDDDKGEAHLTYQVHKGYRYRLGNIYVEGNTAFPRGYFVSKINPLFFYRPSRVREALEEIRVHYQKKGYFRSRISLTQVHYNEEDRTVDLTLDVNEHDHVTLRFKGNHSISDHALKEASTFLSNGDYDQYEIDKTQKALETYYHRKGFRQVQIQSTVTEKAAGELDIRYQINEGVRSEVYAIRFSGNQVVSSGRLKNGMKTKENGLFQKSDFNDKSFQEDLKQIPQLYREKGYLRALVKEASLQWNDDQSKVLIAIGIEEGQETLVSQAFFEGNVFFDSKYLGRKIKQKEGRVFKPLLFQADQDRLRELYLKEGFPYARVESALSWDTEKSGLSIIHRIEEGPRVRVGKILVVGNSLTREESVQKALSLHEGDYYIQQKVLDSAANLRRLGAFASANIDTLGLETKESVVPLLVKVEENNRYVSSLAGSFDTYEHFSGELTLTNQNIFGFAKRGNLKIKGGERLQRGEINFIDPRLAGTNLELITTGFTQYEDDIAFNALQAGGGFSLLHQWTPNLMLLGRMNLTQTYITDEDGTASKRDNTLSEIGFSTTYDTRDYFADPKRGLFVLGSTDLATTIFGEQSSFMKLRTWFGDYRTPTSLGFLGRWTLANNLRFEGIKNLTDGAIPIQQLLFVGGDYTVRGFSQDQLGPKGATGDPTGGQLSLVHNVELLCRLYGNFKAVAFLDSGTLTDTVGAIDLDSLRHAAGLGLRYITPLGPIRLDYGYKLDRQPGEARGRIHFTFGYPF